MAVSAVVEVILCRHRPSLVGGGWGLDMWRRFITLFIITVAYIDVDGNAGHVQYRFPLGKFLQKDEVKRWPKIKQKKLNAICRNLQAKDSQLGLDGLFFFLPYYSYSQNFYLIFLSYYLIFFSSCLLFPV